MKKVLFPLIVLLVVACTVGLYYLLFDGETTKLFYVNIVVVSIADVLLLSNIPIWSGEKMMTVKNAAVSVSVNMYAVLLFLWTTLYTLAIHNPVDENYKPFYIGLLLLTLPFVIYCGATLIGGETAEKQVKELEVSVSKKKIIVFSVQDTLMNIKDALYDDNSDWKDESLRALRTIADKIDAMPITKLSNHADITIELKERFQEIGDICEGLATAEDKGALKAKITRKISQLKNYLVTIKTIM